MKNSPLSFEEVLKYASVFDSCEYFQKLICVLKNRGKSQRILSPYGCHELQLQITLSTHIRSEQSNSYTCEQLFIVLKLDMG